jgi:hypothetical protein
MRDGGEVQGFSRRSVSRVIVTRFQATSEQIDGSTLVVHVEWDGAPITMHDAFSLLEKDAGFRAGLASTLRSAPFEGYFWETPPTSARSSERPFEFTLTDAPSFRRATPERSAFQEHFSKDSDGDGVVTFENLGGDATLVVPCPIDDEASYAHLGAFVRNGPSQQVDALFRCVGLAASRRLSDRPQWLSTAGMGVYWLHVRIDSRPKYYRHTPYKAAP